MNPTNIDAARAEFLTDTTKPPHFEYSSKPSLREKRLRMYKVHTAHYKTALAVVEGVVSDYGTWDKYIDIVWGNIVDNKKAQKHIEEYLACLDVTTKLKVRVSDKAVANTSVGKKFVTLSTRAQQRSGRLMSTCHHELGTHFLRRYNDANQVWHKKRKALGVRPPSLETEEGLACVNTHLEVKDKRLAAASLNYCAVIWSQSMSFVQLYEFMQQFFKPDSELLWLFCLRVKRGLKDQTCVGAYAKDQLYFIGAHKILKHRHTLDFGELYAGRIALASLAQCSRLRKHNKPKVVLPPFLQDAKKYVARLDQIVKHNGLQFASRCR